MDNEKQYTIRQIAELGLEKYKVQVYIEQRESTIDNIRKQIGKIIKREGIKHTGMKKSTPQAKRPARAYSDEIKDKLLNDYLFDYLVELTRDESVKNYKSPEVYQKQVDELNGQFEDATLDFLNLTREKKDDMMKRQYNIDSIGQYHSIILEKKKDIMLEAIFSKYYSLDMDRLIKDTKRVEFAKYYKQGELDKDDMRALERYDSWESYVDKK